MIGYKKNLFVKAVKNGRIRWQKHALERMLERDIFRNDVKEVIIEGEIIEEYPGDLPYPSVLILGYPGKNPLHVVAALDLHDHWCYIITVYRPDSLHFENDNKTRKK